MQIKKKIKYGKNRSLLFDLTICRTGEIKRFKSSPQKIFCIGANKTGTTSLNRTFRDFGFKVGIQREAEMLQRDVFAEDYIHLINYCKSAQVFQDVPFSQGEVYKVLDNAFPDSKFILSVRDSAEQWYNSLTKFHAKRFGRGEIPTWEVLKNTRYVYRGWSYENRKHIFGLTEEDDPYDKEKLTAVYEQRNQMILDYFQNRPEDLLVINLSDKGAFQKFCQFIGVESNATEFPWENKTTELKTK